MVELFPDKFTPTEQTVIGEAAEILVLLSERNITIGQLFIEHKLAKSSTTFDSFATALTFLYAAGVIDFQDQIVRVA